MSSETDEENNTEWKMTKPLEEVFRVNACYQKIPKKRKKEVLFLLLKWCFDELEKV